MKELIELYHQDFAGLEEELAQRTPDEAAYDGIIIKELKKGQIDQKGSKNGGPGVSR